MPASGRVRPAATLLLVRDGADPVAPLEVLLVRRALDADFVGGAHVFPGGAVDVADGDAEAGDCCTGRSDAEASRILGVASGGLAYWVAALRECFEEAGVLLAYAPGVPALLSLARPGDAERFDRHRRAVNAGQRCFVDVCREERVLLALDRVHYFAHWVTPAGATRRYDTRFFLADAPPGQAAAHDAGETVAARWFRPADALAAHRDGLIDLIFPTIRNLQAIGRFRTSGELLAAASAATVADDGTATAPRTVPDGNGVRILLPGDPGWVATRGRIHFP